MLSKWPPASPGTQGPLNTIKTYNYTLNCDGAVDTVSVVVQAFDYTLSNSGQSSVVKGGSDVYTNNTITKTLTAGVTESVNLALSGVPPTGVSYSITYNPGNPANPCNPPKPTWFA